MNKKSWTVTLEEDKETNELIFPFPEDLLTEMQWKEGDVLEWDVKDDGSIVISKQ
jgi:bifunctional DNA-binding transcriptional regulator/antitoxin component of YhaV-PrlF toxin-antitoxin module